MQVLERPGAVALFRVILSDDVLILVVDVYLFVVVGVLVIAVSYTHLSLTAGFTFHLGKVGWKRAVDATSYIRQNEWLVNHANILSGENKRYKDRCV